MHVVVVAEEGGFDLIEHGVNLPLFLSLAEGSVCLGVPAVRADVLLGGEVGHLAVDSDAGNNGCFPIGFCLRLLDEEKNFECCFHL